MKNSILIIMLFWLANCNAQSLLYFKDSYNMSNTINSYRFDNGIPFEQYGIYDEAAFDDLVFNQNYIPVATPDELNNLRNITSQTMGVGTKYENTYTTGKDKKYVQYIQLDLISFLSFSPIGTSVSVFTGIYDGNSIDILNLTITGSSDYSGLFGETSGASTIKNVICYGDVSGGNQTGGVIGQSFGMVFNCEYYGDVSGLNNTGGVVGAANGPIGFSKSSTGTVTGGDNVGGVAGLSVQDVYNCESNMIISATGDRVGGLVGQVQGDVYICKASGNVSSSTGRDTGGLIGKSLSGCFIYESYATGNVDNANFSAGGFIGDNNASIDDCYATGNIITSSGTYRSGFAAVNRSNITNSYSIGLISGGSSLGGFIGLQVSGSVNNCYYDTNTSGQSDTGKGDPKTTTEMHQGTIPDTAIYVTWNPSIWDPVDTNNYPEIINLQ